MLSKLSLTFLSLITACQTTKVYKIWEHGYEVTVQSQTAEEADKLFQSKGSELCPNAFSISKATPTAPRFTARIECTLISASETYADTRNTTEEVTDDDQGGKNLESSKDADAIANCVIKKSLSESCIQLADKIIAQNNELSAVIDKAQTINVMLCLTKKSEHAPACYSAAEYFSNSEIALNRDRSIKCYHQMCLHGDGESCSKGYYLAQIERSSASTSLLKLAIEKNSHECADQSSMSCFRLEELSEKCDITSSLCRKLKYSENLRAEKEHRRRREDVEQAYRGRMIKLQQEANERQEQAERSRASQDMTKTLGDSIRKLTSPPPSHHPVRPPTFNCTTTDHGLGRSSTNCYGQ